MNEQQTAPASSDGGRKAMAYVTTGPEYERAWSVIEDVYGSTACRFEGTV